MPIDVCKITPTGHWKEGVDRWPLTHQTLVYFWVTDNLLNISRVNSCKLQITDNNNNNLGSTNLKVYTSVQKMHDKNKMKGEIILVNLIIIVMQKHKLKFNV